jgi:hypothetical protein
MIGFEAFSALLGGLKTLSERKHEKDDAKEKHLAAIMAVRAAALETKAYLYDRSLGSNEDRAREALLSQKWNDAARAIGHYDGDLFQIAQMKSLGWADPQEWDHLPIDPDKLKLDLILRQCDFLLAE